MKDSNLGSPSCCRKGFLERAPCSSFSVSSPDDSALARLVVLIKSTSGEDVQKVLGMEVANCGGRVAPNARERRRAAVQMR